MKGRLFLHIGPPKTATTALQYAFEELSDEAFVYSGVFQPREERNFGSPSDILLRAANRSQTNQDSLPEEVLGKIREDVRSGKIVMISEEMLGLSHVKPMAQKLAFLGQCFEGLPTTVVLCIRNPLDAIPSLYQEIYRFQPLLMKLSFSRFCRSEAIDCYDYSKVLTSLRDAGFGTIRMISFERVCSGELTVQDVFDHPSLPDKRLSLRKVNTSRINSDKKARVLEPISLAILGGTKLFRKLRKVPPFRNDRVVRFLTAVATWIRIPNSAYRKLSIPAAQASHFMDAYRAAQALEVTYLDQPTPSVNRDTA